MLFEPISSILLYVGRHKWIYLEMDAKESSVTTTLSLCFTKLTSRRTTAISYLSENDFRSSRHKKKLELEGVQAVGFVLFMQSVTSLVKKLTNTG